MAEEQQKVPRDILVVGCGGGGNIAVAGMDLLDGRIRRIVVDTDEEALQNLPGIGVVKLPPIGRYMTGGKSTGGNARLATAAIKEGIGNVAEHLVGAGMVFIVTYLGGGISMMAPIIAEKARAMGAVVVGVTVDPFGVLYAGVRERAKEGKDGIFATADFMVAIKNEIPVSSENKEVAAADYGKKVFGVANKVLAETILKAVGIIEEAEYFNPSSKITAPGLFKRFLIEYGRVNMSHALFKEKFKISMEDVRRATRMLEEIDGADANSKPMLCLSLVSEEGGVEIDDLVMMDIDTQAKSSLAERRIGLTHSAKHRRNFCEYIRGCMKARLMPGTSITGTLGAATGFPGTPENNSGRIKKPAQASLEEYLTAGLDFFEKCRGALSGQGWKKGEGRAADVVSSSRRLAPEEEIAYHDPGAECRGKRERRKQ